MSIVQYLKDTQGELRHVAWPTRLQTIVYTILVALISIGVSLYLGLFDFLFTTGLSRFLQILPAASPAPIEQPIATSTAGAASTSSTQAVPQFDLKIATTTGK